MKTEIVYHGTTENFSNFSEPSEDWGIFFTDSKYNAKEFALARDSKCESYVIEAILTFENPEIVDWEEDVFDFHLISVYLRDARKEGKDGVIVKNIADNVRGNSFMETQYIVFNTNQIKIIKIS